MVGYTEVLNVMGAMVIFGLILMSSNRLIQRNTFMQVEGELEQETVAVAQDLLEESRTKDFDEQSTFAVAGNLPPAKIPGDFTTSTSFGPDGGETDRSLFDDFDDYNNYADSVKTEHGWFKINCNVFYVDPTTFDSTATKSAYKKMKVYVSSKFLTKNGSQERKQYHFEFIRNYYAD